MLFLLFFFPFTSRNCCSHTDFKSSNSASFLSESKIHSVAPLFKQQQEEEPPKSCCSQWRSLLGYISSICSPIQGKSAWRKEPSSRGTKGVTYWGDGSTVEVHRLWHGSWELDPLESLEVQLPNISQNHLSVVASAHKHICKRGDVGNCQAQPCPCQEPRDTLGERSGITFPTQVWDQ